MQNKEFEQLTRDIVCSDEYLGMKNYRHHIKRSAYEHSLKVAYYCYKHHKRFDTKIDLSEFLRGALLHDYYLYDWHDKQHRFHGFTHPKYALKNAEEKYPDLTPNERDMIRHHMFPLTPVPPRTKAGWLICFYDKVAAMSDYLGKNTWKLEHPEPQKNAAAERSHFAKKENASARYNIVTIKIRVKRNPRKKT